MGPWDTHLFSSRKVNLVHLKKKKKGTGTQIGHSMEITEPKDHLWISRQDMNPLVIYTQIRQRDANLETLC